MRLPMLDIDRNSSGAIAPDEIADLVEAAEELGSQLGSEPAVIVRELTGLLRRRTTFAKLNAQFGATLEPRAASRV